jgi:cbb3-type cytochrome oxidase subunit 1
MLGGVMFLTGMLMMVYNLIMTVRSPTTAPRAVARNTGALPSGYAVAGE